MPDPLIYEDASGDIWEAKAYMYLPADIHIKWNDHEAAMVCAPRWLYKVYRNDDMMGMVALPQRGDKRDPIQAAEFAAEVIPSFLEH